MPIAFADARNFAPMPPSPITPSVLPSSCTPSCGVQTPRAHLAIHARDIAGRAKYQGDGVFGDCGIAVAFD